MWTQYEVYIGDQLFYTSHRLDDSIEIAIRAKKEHKDERVVLYKLTEEVVEFDA